MVKVEFHARRDLVINSDGLVYCKMCDHVNQCEHTGYLMDRAIGASFVAKFLEDLKEDQERTIKVSLSADSVIINFYFERTSVPGVWTLMFMGFNDIEMMTFVQGIDSFEDIGMALNSTGYAVKEKNPACSNKDHFKRSSKKALVDTADIISWMQTRYCTKCATAGLSTFDDLIPEADDSPGAKWGSSTKAASAAMGAIMTSASASGGVVMTATEAAEKLKRAMDNYKVMEV